MNILFLLQPPLEKESDGGSSSSRRSASGGRGERSSSEIQGFFTAKVGHERDGNEGIGGGERRLFGAMSFGIQENNVVLTLGSWDAHLAALWARVLRWCSHQQFPLFFEWPKQQSEGHGFPLYDT
ncbi:hypothetical protein PIB30_104656, partial [Stylosanthes scabra]|nr:hypothetical protein [Stylosanthes scabra]